MGSCHVSWSKGQLQKEIVRIFKLVLGGLSSWAVTVMIHKISATLDPLSFIFLGTADASSNKQ